MVSNAETNEENWNYLQKHLSSNRKKQQQIGNKKINNRSSSINNTNNNNNTYSENLKNKRRTTSNNNNLNTNRTNLDSSFQITDRSNGATLPLKKEDGQGTYIKEPRFVNNIGQQNTQMNATFKPRSAYSPLNTPSVYRNNSSRNDQFGINPLPNIRSPYTSARLYTNVPDLESWGVQNATNNNNFDDPYSYRYYNNVSPFLPIYNSIMKNQKPYIVVPKLNRSLYETPDMPNLDSYTANPRLNYISVKPYKQTAFLPINEIPQLSVVDEHETFNQKLKSDEYLRSANEVLKNFETKNYDGKELFSTKFLEDLEYKPEPLPKTAVKKKVRLATEPEVETYFQDIKEEAKREVPNTNYKEKLKAPYNVYAVDVAENIYRKEVEDLVRRLAETTIQEQKDFRNSLVGPMFHNILYSTTNQMTREIAREVLEEHNKQIQFLQTNEIKKLAKEKLVNNLMLDHMLGTMVQHGKVVAENDDVTKILDSMQLEILLNTTNDVRKTKDKTLKNYPLKKFHLNSYMNVALDILVAELSSSLEEDMKELDELQKKN